MTRSRRRARHAAVRHASALAVACTMLFAATGCGGGSHPAKGQGGQPQAEQLPPPPPPKDPNTPAAPPLVLWAGVTPTGVVQVAQNDLRDYEHMTIASLQGLMARGSNELVWIRPNDGEPWLDYLSATRGISVDTVFSALDMLARFQDKIPGYVRVDSLGNPHSINAGISQAGHTGTIVIDQREELHVATLGLPMLYDVTGYDEPRLLAENPTGWNPSIVFEQKPDILPLLKDLPVLTGGFIYHAGEGRPPFAEQVLAAQPPGAYLLGWRGQNSEQPMVEDASLNSLSLVACDQCQNLSTLAQFPFQPPPRPAPPPAPAVENGTHYVSLMVTDGDNVGFLQNTMWNEQYYGNGLRGAYPLTWEMSPSLVKFAPPILEWYLSHATVNDSFVAGSSGKGYILPHLEPNLNRFLDETEPLLYESGLHIVTAIDDVPLSSGAYDSYANRASIDAVIAKIGPYYQAGDGAVRWVNDKPIVSVRAAIWDDNLTPEQAATAVNALPRAPGAGTNAVSIVVIHPFSRFGTPNNEYGLIDVGRRFRDGLSTHVHLVSIEQAISLLHQLR